MSGQSNRAGTDCADNTPHSTADELYRYVHHRLTGPERERIERKLENCEYCLEQFMAVLEAPDAERADNGPAASQAAGADKELPRYQGVSVAEIPFQPELPDMAVLEERIVARLLQEERDELASRRAQSLYTAAQEKPYRRQTWLQHPVTHCTIAASITLLLLGSGTFGAISEKLAQHDSEWLAGEARQEDPRPPAAAHEAGGTRAASWSDKMVSQTSSWLDGLQALRFK